MSEHKIGLPDVDVLHPERGSIFFVGTATTIIKLGGFTILTDPNFLHAGDHIHLGYGLTAKRLTNPAMEIEQLPRIDACILSHMHADHFDRVAMEKLPRELPIITNNHAARRLSRHGFHKSVALKNWESAQLTRGGNWLRVTSMPGKHGPGLMDPMLPDVMGSMLEWGIQGVDQPVFSLYISGDTLVHDRLKEIPSRYPQINLALIHLGGTRVLGILVTMDAKQGIEALRIIRPEKAIPIHYNDYDRFKSPLEDFIKAAAQANLATDLHYLSHGETYEFRIDPLARAAA